uniref:KilA-N domain n=1 Tax=Myoviridae sp. ctTK08 TaxID=2826656 RepID=A0A8S5QWB3_9CAUD|nr:MAG TPA: KilA-N domain [Myoviridae sp. ctTK08]
MNLIQISNVSIRQHNGLYSLNDLHRAAGGENRHKPSLWTSNQQTIELIKEVEKAGNPAILSKQGLGTFVCKELVIHYGMWISPSFSLQVIRTFLAVQEQGSLKSQTTTDQRTPLRQAVSALVGARGIDYSTAYKMVHQRFGVSAIEEIPLDLLPAAVEYVHRLTLTGEVLDAPIQFSQSELRELATVTYYCAWACGLLRELAAPLSDLGYAKASTLRTLPNESRFFLRRAHKALLREMPKIVSELERECMQNSLMRCELFI